MALVKDLCGVGIAPEAASLLGSTVASIAAAGSSATDATIIGKAATVVLVTPTGGSQGVKLPADAELCVDYIVANVSSTAALIYPPSLGQINGDTATTGTVPLNARGTTICRRVSVTGWIATVGAAG
jgi:hypothetical protein